MLMRPDRFMVQRNLGGKVRAHRFGSGQYGRLQEPLSGVSDGTVGIIVIWAKLDVLNLNNFLLAWGTISATKGFMRKNGGVPVEFVSNVLDKNTSANLARIDGFHDTYPAGEWRCHLYSWSVASPGPAIAYRYVNDTADEDTTILNAGDPGYSVDRFAIGAATSWTNEWNGGIGPVYVNFDAGVDFSNVTNRRKFIDADGKPVDLGADGSGPTGAQPAIYLPYGDPTDNKGYSQNFDMVGDVEPYPSSPWD